AAADPGGEQVAEDRERADVARQIVEKAREGGNFGIVVAQVGVAEEGDGLRGSGQRRTRSANPSFRQNSCTSPVRTSRSRSSEMKRFWVSETSGVSVSPVL